MSKAFTLIEVLISVVIIFMIGMTFVKISSQNVNVLQSAKVEMNSYSSAVINSSSEYRSLNDYIVFRDIPRTDAVVEKKRVDLGVFPLVSTEEFSINYTLQNEKVKINDETKSYFRIW